MIPPRNHAAWLGTNCCTDQANGTITVTSDAPPDCNAGGPYMVECAGPVTVVSVDGSGSSDADSGDTSTCQWNTNCPGATLDDNTLESPTLTATSAVPCGPALTCNVFLPVG